MSSITSMDEVVNILCKLSILHCKVLFGEAERFEEWLKEKGIKDKYAPKEIYNMLVLILFKDLWKEDRKGI
ncbi:unnamed protein product [Rhizophagus irregularis]|nr:unnamed protein product [Rhizophagus irregularis]